MQEKTINEQAIDIFDGVVEIINNEMLGRGLYITEVVRPDLAEAGSICGGHRACMVGSMLLAAQVPQKRGRYFDLMGLHDDEWISENRRDLALAFAVMNEVSWEYAKEFFPDAVEEGCVTLTVPATCQHGAMEGLFENTHITDEQLLEVIARAKERLAS